MGLKHELGPAGLQCTALHFAGLAWPGLACVVQGKTRAGHAGQTGKQTGLAASLGGSAEGLERLRGVLGGVGEVVGDVDDLAVLADDVRNAAGQGAEEGLGHAP